MACSLIKYLYVLLTPISACYKSHFLSNSWTSKEFCFDQKKKKKSGSFHLYWITSLSFIDGCLEPPFTQEKYSNGQKKLKKAESSEATRAHGKLAFYFQGQREPDCGEHGMGRGHLRRDPPADGGDQLAPTQSFHQSRPTWRNFRSVIPSLCSSFTKTREIILHPCQDTKLVFCLPSSSPFDCWWL